MAKPELKILIGLHRAVNDIDRQSARIFAEYGLTTGQFAVLEALYHKGDLTVGQVQAKILSSGGTMPLIIRNLEKNGYLTSSTSPSDKRCCILHLTDKGRDLIAAVYPLNEARIISCMSVWTPAEQEQLAALLKKYGDHCQPSKPLGT